MRKEAHSQDNLNLFHFLKGTEKERGRGREAQACDKSPGPALIVERSYYQHSHRLVMIFVVDDCNYGQNSVAFEVAPVEK